MQHSETSAIQEFVTNHVVLACRFFIVHGAIYFDDQALANSAEVHDTRPDRMLPPKV